jgi:hypothetical protein
VTDRAVDSHVKNLRRAKLEKLRGRQSICSTMGGLQL